MEGPFCKISLGYVYAFRKFIIVLDPQFFSICTEFRTKSFVKDCLLPIILQSRPHALLPVYKLPDPCCSLASVSHLTAASHPAGAAVCDLRKSSGNERPPNNNFPCSDTKQAAGSRTPSSPRRDFALCGREISFFSETVWCRVAFALWHKCVLR